MEYRLDVVAVGIDQEGGVISRVIGALTRIAIGNAAGLDTGLKDLLHHLTAARLKRQMDSTGQMSLCGAALLSRNEQLIGPKIIGTRAANRDLQAGEDGFVEALAGGQVAHHELNVINQPATIKLLSFHMSSFPLRRLRP